MIHNGSHQAIVDLEQGRVERRRIGSGTPGSWLRSSSSSPTRLRSNGQHTDNWWPSLPWTPSKDPNNLKRRESKEKKSPNQLNDIILHRIRILINVTRCTNIPWTWIFISLQSTLLFVLLVFRNSFALRTDSEIKARLIDMPSLIDEDVMSRTISHLILVPGHAVVSSWHSNANDDNAWWLYKYQQGFGVPSLLIHHIEAGVKAAAEDPAALLMFSGGATRSGAGPRTEAASYYYMADAMGWWGHTPIADRTVLEEYARDSFENILFALARFHEVVGKFPSNVMVVGFNFKRDRFRNQHRRALRFPESMFEYKGLYSNIGSFDIESALRGEKETSDGFEVNPYVCMDETPNILLEKRQSRDPFRRQPPYALSVPEMANLLK